MMLRSLAVKWTATLLLTSLIGVILAGVFAFRTTRSEYDRLRSEQARTLFVENVLTYYLVNGSWSGVDDWMHDDDSGGWDQPFGYRSPQMFALAGINGEVIIGGGPFHTGETLSLDTLTEGTPIFLDGEFIGTALLAEPPPELDPREQQYVDSANRALVIGALGASATALVVGLILSRQFLNPLSDLTRAINAMHAGDLDQQVKIRSRDELGSLAQTFNEMSANLHRANQLRKQMTADIAHDLRTPLTVIAGYLEALSDGTFKPTPERFRVMSEEVNLLQRLVEDLRMLSLADAGELKLTRALIAPHELLDRVSASFRDSAAASGITLTVESSPDLPEILIDSERMVQVLGNLVTNSLRHTPSGGSITVTAHPKGKAVELRVRDTGSGIAQDDLTRIFERFYRADPSRHSESGESGLGLAIAKSIVEAHGGTIGAESEVGKGTSMIITLPVTA